MSVMFDDTLHRYTHCASNEHSHAQTMRMQLALRLQTQCAATARTLGAISYMKHIESLHPKKADVPPPHQKHTAACGHDEKGGSTPAINDERTEGLSNDQQ